MIPDLDQLLSALEKIRSERGNMPVSIDVDDENDILYDCDTPHVLRSPEHDLLLVLSRLKEDTSTSYTRNASTAVGGEGE